MFRSTRGLQITALLVLSLGAGTLLYLTASYFKRKRREPSTGKSSSYNDRPVRRKRTATSGSARLSVTDSSRAPAGASSGLHPDLVYRPHAASSRLYPGGIDSNVITADGRTSEDSAVDLGDIADEEEIIEELIRRGVESFEMAIEHWYDAVEIVIARQRQTISHEDLHFIIEADSKLHALIGSSRKLRKVIKQYSLAGKSLPRTPTPSHMLTWIDEESLQEQLQLDFNESLGDEENSSDAESFVSASDNAQLEFDDITEETLVNESQRLKLFREAVLRTAANYRHLEFYVSGLQQYTLHGISCRKLRTLVVGCENEMEFLAKVHCVRQASEMVFSSPETREWFVNSGRQAISAVIERAGKDPSDFQAAYDELVQYSSSPENWEQIKDELSGRGVTDLTFYDVLLDFVLLDAFDDLETPPYSVVTAVQNRWLSARIKETALTTAIWGVLKAKTSYLQDQYGFMAHFYVVSQYVLPVLAWGFLGPDEELKRVCEYFKEHILGFIKDLFDFNVSDYSSVNTLCSSIVSLAKERRETLLRGDLSGETNFLKTPSFDPTQIVKGVEITQC